MAARNPAPVTLGDWLQWAQRAYARHGLALGQVATSAHDEALYLLLHTLGLPLDTILDFVADRNHDHFDEATGVYDSFVTADVRGYRTLMEEHRRKSGPFRGRAQVV